MSTEAQHNPPSGAGYLSTIGKLSATNKNGFAEASRESSDDPVRHINSRLLIHNGEQLEVKEIFHHISQPTSGKEPLMDEMDEKQGLWG